MAQKPLRSVLRRNASAQRGNLDRIAELCSQCRALRCSLSFRGRTSAIACAAAITAACPATLGAVYPTLNEPSLFPIAAAPDHCVDVVAVGERNTRAA